MLTRKTLPQRARSKRYWTAGPQGRFSRGAMKKVQPLLPAEIDRRRRAGRAAAQTLKLVGQRLAAGVTTAQIDAWVRAETQRLGGRPSQLGYHGFPATVCTSRN